MRQRGFGIVVEQQTRRDEVTRHQVGGVSIQSREFAAYFGRELLGFDVVGDVRAGRARRFTFGRRLCATGSTRSRGPRQRSSVAPVATTAFVVSHVHLCTRCAGN
jgi:hypothetical protein